MMKKMALVSMVRNESDIIELFLKINLRVFDHAFIIDHCSQDGTIEILKKLKYKIPKIEIFSYGKIEYHQSEVMTKMVRMVARKNIFDYIVPLDADEFIYPNDHKNIRAILDEQLQTNEAGLIPWETYVPISSNYFSSASPIFTCFKKRTREPEQFFKVILGNEYAKDCNLSMGNHSAISRIFPSKNRLIPGIKVQHTPVRSSQQMISKVLLGSYTNALRKNRSNHECSHWDNLADTIRKNNFQIDHEQLLSMALNYASQQEQKIDVDWDSLGIGNADDTLYFTDLAQPNLIKDLDFLISSLITKINPQQ
jgi:hypothetical protein